MTLSSSGFPCCPAFVSKYWNSTCDGELLVGEIPVFTLAEQYGTPIFAYDRSILERKYGVLREALPKRFVISYSVKANPNPAFLKFFLEKGMGLEVASAGELYIAMSAGCAPEDILFAGPGKTESELELAIREGVGEIHAESQLEIERISQIGKRLGLVPSVALRVNPSEGGQGGAMRMGGKSVPFGVDEEEMDAVLQRIVRDPQLAFRGIHLFAGTQILDCDTLLAQYRTGFKIARRAAHIAGNRLHTLDCGGGLGIPYFSGDSELDLVRLRKGLLELMTEIEAEPCFTNTRFMIEPGRFLVGECGIYVARVNDIKTSRGTTFLILDGGMNHHLAASGNLGQVIKRNFPIAVLNKMKESAAEPVDVVGPLCTPLDTLGRSVLLPKVEVGDLIGIFQSGAYARSASPLGFLSHPSPPELWIEHNRDFLIRKRGESADHFRDVTPVEPQIELNPAGRGR